jgi:hypothetical protein
VTGRAILGVAALVLLLAGSARAQPAARDDGWLLSIRSDSACPDAGTVDRRTRELLGLGGDVSLRESVELAHEGSGLSVRLRGDDQRLLGERVLPLDEDCDALARAVSVVLASWLTGAHPEFLAPREAAPPEPAPALPPAPPPRPRAAPHVGARGTLRVDDRLRFRPAAGIGGLADSSGFVPAGMVGLGVAPAGSGLGAFARVVVSLERTLPLGGGEVWFFRYPLAVGGVVRLEGGALSGELHAGAAVAWLHLQGRGFRPNRSVNDAAFGLFAALRVSLALGVVEPFLEAAAFGWPGAGSAYVDPPDPGVALPRGEVVPVLGATFRP